MADDHGGTDRRTNGEINLEAIARFQIEVDKNQKYCGDLDDDLEFLAKHIDEDPEIFHHYVEMKFQNSQENDLDRLGEKTNGDINLEAIARFQIEVDENPYYCGDLDDDLEFLVRHIDEDPEIFHRYVDIVLLYNQEERNNTLYLDDFLTFEPELRELIANMVDQPERGDEAKTEGDSSSSSSADLFTTMLKISKEYPQLWQFPVNMRIKEHPELRELIANMVDQPERGDEAKTEGDSSSSSSADLFTTMLKICKEYPQLWQFSINMHIKEHPEHRELLDVLKRGDETKADGGKSSSADFVITTAQKIIKEDPQLLELEFNELIKEHPDNRELFVNMLDQLKRESQADIETNPKLVESVFNQLIEEHPDMFDQLKRGIEADAERESLYTSDSYREFESHYRTLQQLMKNDPDIVDWVIHMLVEENPEERETCLTVFDRLKRRTIDVQRLIRILGQADRALDELIEEHQGKRDADLRNDKRKENEANTAKETDSTFLMDYQYVQRLIKDPKQADRALNERMEEHSSRGINVRMKNQHKQEQDRATEEKKVLVKYPDGIVSFLNELLEEHPEILHDESDKDTQDRFDKQGAMLSGTLRWISMEPRRFDEYTWLTIQNNPEHGREIARMTDYMKLRAKVMTLQELFEVDPEQFDQLVEEIIQENQNTGDIVVEEAVDQRQKARNLKAIDMLMTHLEQNPMYFGNDLTFLLKHIDELPELFDNYVGAIVSYNQEDKDTILYPENNLKHASKIMDILEKHSKNVTSGSLGMALINDEPALFDEYAMSRVERNATRQWKLISTMTEGFKLLQEESVATGITNSSTVDRGTKHGECSVIQNTLNNGNARSSLEENRMPLLEKYYLSAARAEIRNLPPLRSERPYSDVTNSVKYLRESLANFVNLIEKSKGSQVEKSEDGDEDMEDEESKTHELNGVLERLQEAQATGGDPLPLLKEIYALSPIVADCLVAPKIEQKWNQLKRMWDNERKLSLQIDSDYSWIQNLFQVDTGKMKETLEHIMRTVMNRNETLVMINELKTPFERERISWEYFLTGRREHFDKVLYFIDEYPELFIKVPEDIVKWKPELEKMVSFRKAKLLTELETKKIELLLSLGNIFGYIAGIISKADFTELQSSELHDGMAQCETMLTSLLGTDGAVLDHMIKSLLEKHDRQSGDVLRGIRVLKLNMLLEKDTKLLQNVLCIHGFESNDTLPLGAMMKEHLQIIKDNYPTGTDAERSICVAGSTYRLDKISDFAQNRNEMMKLHSQLQKEGRSKSHKDTRKKIEDVKAIISTLNEELRLMLDCYITEGNVAMVRRFIEAGIDLEMRDRQNETMLSYAVKIGEDDMVAMLIKAGCDVDAGDCLRRSILCYAAQCGHNSIVKKIIKAGAAVEDEAIDIAIANNHVDILKTLLKHAQHFIQQNEDTWIFLAVKFGNYDFMSFLIKSGITAVDDENQLQGALLRTVQDGGGNGGAIAVLQTDMLSPSLNMNIDYIRQVAMHGDIDLYRQLVLRCKPRYPDIIDLPYKKDLPYFPAGDCIVHTTATQRQIHSQFQVDEWFPDITEITTLPGYGRVDRLFFLEDLGNGSQLHTFREISKYCDNIIEDSIKYAEIKKEKIRFSYRRCGSSAEGTKVSFPDEFDYFLQCHVDIDDLDIIDKGYGYKVVSIQNFSPVLYLPINRGSKQFHDMFMTSLTTCTQHKDKIMSSQAWTRGGGTASSEWKIRYKLDDDHSLDISVDLVPVLHVDGWPNDARQKTWLMNKEELQEEGYAFVAKPPSRKSRFGKRFTDHIQQTMWRISFGHLEARHLAELEQRTKDVYITCKAIRNPDISHMMFKDSDGKPLSMSGDLITSYWLKMVFMFNVPEFLLQRRTLVEMVYIVYSQVAVCISRWWLPFYWQPHINVLEGLSQDPKQCKQAAKLMKRLVTGWYMRDGQNDTVEEEETKEGGIYPYLPPKPKHGRRTRVGNGGEDPADARETKKDDDAITGGAEGSDGVGGLEDGDKGGGVEVGDRVGGPGDGDALDGIEDNGAERYIEDEDDSEDEFEIITYSRTPNTLRDPGYNLYRL